MTVEELMKLLKKENPKAEVTVYFDEIIDHIFSVGGDSYLTNKVVIVIK